VRGCPHPLRLLLASLGLALGLPGCTGEGSPGRDLPTPEEPTPMPPFELCINEFQPSNSSGIQDASGEWADWLELHNPTDAAVPLEGYWLTDDPKEPDKHLFADDAVIDAGGFLFLWADGDPSEGSDHVAFGLNRDGGLISLGDAYGQSSTVHYGPTGVDRVIARTSDCCEGEGCFKSVIGGTPGSSNEEVVLVEEILLARESNWRYLDTGADPGADWTGPEFNEAAWPQGPGPLGYGDSHINSWLEGGGTTTWFRARFVAMQVDEIDVLALRLLRDGGAAVWLNGVEAARSNLPAGPLTPATPATYVVGGQEETLYFPLEADPGLLVEGLNQLAVEVHHAPGDAADLGFDLELLARKAAR